MFMSMGEPFLNYENLKEAAITESKNETNKEKNEIDNLEYTGKALEPQPNIKKT